MPFDAASTHHHHPRPSNPYRIAANLADATDIGGTHTHHDENIRLAREAILTRIVAWQAILSLPAAVRRGVLKAGEEGKSAEALAEADRGTDAGLREVLAALPSDWGGRARVAERALRRTLDALVARNMGLVRRVAARTHAGLSRRPSGDEFRAGHLSKDDLIQEGAIGLMKGIRLFDPERGLKLATYACWWIRHAVQRAVTDKADLVRVPNHVREKVSSASTKARTGERITPAEQWALHILPRIASGDRPVFSAEDTTACLFDCVADESAADPADAIEAARTTAAVDAALASLADHRQATIIRRRFLSDQPETLREIAEGSGLSRERIRQIQEMGLKAMRRHLERAEVRP